MNLTATIALGAALFLSSCFSGPTNLERGSSTPPTLELRRVIGEPGSGVAHHPDGTTTTFHAINDEPLYQVRYEFVLTEGEQEWVVATQLGCEVKKGPLTPQPPIQLHDSLFRGNEVFALTREKTYDTFVRRFRWQPKEKRWRAAGSVQLDRYLLRAEGELEFDGDVVLVSIHDFTKSVIRDYRVTEGSSGLEAELTSKTQSPAWHADAFTDESARRDRGNQR